jgi:hypothetical protein
VILPGVLAGANDGPGGVGPTDRHRRGREGHRHLALVVMAAFLTLVALAQTG